MRIATRLKKLDVPLPAHHAVEVKKPIGKRPAPFKPKNMHWKTFDRLRKAAEDPDELAGLYIAQRWGVTL
jgi:hypothetical protein